MCWLHKVRHDLTCPQRQGVCNKERHSRCNFTLPCLRKKLKLNGIHQTFGAGSFSAFTRQRPLSVLFIRLPWLLHHPMLMVLAAAAAVALVAPVVPVYPGNTLITDPIVDRVSDSPASLPSLSVPLSLFLSLSLYIILPFSLSLSL